MSNQYIKYLSSGQTLNQGDSLSSPNGFFSVTVQTNGLQLTETTGGQTLFWAGGNTNIEPVNASLQADGNFVLYGPNNQILWSSHTGQYTGATLYITDDGYLEICHNNQPVWRAGTLVSSANRYTLTLFPGQQLNLGDSLNSPNGWFSLVLQSNGNLALFDLRSNSSSSLWSSNTSGDSAQCAVMQADGNFVIYTAGGESSGNAEWASHTSNNYGASLTCQNDGNLVIYFGTTDDHSTAKWSTGTMKYSGTENFIGYLTEGQQLNVGETLISSNFAYVLALQADGDLALYDVNKGVVPLWSAGLSGQASAKVVMQSDGNFVVYNTSSQPTWASGTWNNSGAYLFLQNNGNLSVYNGNSSLWQTKTAKNPAVYSLVMNTNQALNANDCILSPNERYQLLFQQDGNLVLYDLENNQKILWQTNTGNQNGQCALMQTDCNFVIYTGGGGSAGSAIWDSKTSDDSGYIGPNLNCQSDGNVVIYAEGVALWQTNTP